MNTRLLLLRAILLTLFGASLAGCWGDGDTSSSSTSPTISGIPSSTATVGRTYAFHPKATATTRTPLQFSVDNRPSWAAFDAATGTLSGTPAAKDQGTYAQISIAVTDGASSAKLSPFSIRVGAAAQASNLTGLGISGKPALSVAADASYSFRPTIAGSSGTALKFAIANPPAWAHFDAGTGILSGTPAAADVGTYADIAISVTDGAVSASLAPFSIVVTQANAVAADISWTIPPASATQTAATQLAGYRIYYGASAESMTHVVSVDDPATTSFVLADLEHGTWYFAIASYDVGKVESVLSPTVSASL